MKDHRLLASAALFRELYDNNKDIYDVISEFIRASILLNSKWTFNATECTQSLQNNFGFQIPEAVIKTCLKNRLQRNEETTLERGIYTVTEKFDRSKSIQPNLKTSQSEYNEIVENLVKHVRALSVTDIDTEKLKSNFNDYLLDERIPSEYVKHINHFLLKYEFDKDFKEKLNRIEEGLVLYAGIRYSPDLSSLGHWCGDLIIFLDTEHLFSAAGLNGVLYQQIFDDFNSLVKEVNSKKSKYGKIKLQYFEETNAEVENFFYSAEKIVENHRQIDPSKTAMLAIVNGCSSKSDVLGKKSNFLGKLRQLKIEIEESQNYYGDNNFNIEDEKSISNLKEAFGHKTEDDRCSGILKIFTKVNCIRNGNSKLAIDRVPAIFMTENRLTQRVAFSDIVYGGNGSIPFATNIEFLTERLWFKLNKGFGANNKTPASFDVIIKAKLVLSSQVKKSVSERFNEIKAQYDRGDIDNESTALLISELRNKPSSPDNISTENIDDSINFIGDIFIENVLREKTILEKRSEDGAKAINELKSMKHEKRIEKSLPIKKVAIRQYQLIRIFCYILLPASLIYFVSVMYSSNDTLLSLVFGVIGVVSFIVGKINFKKIDRYIWRLSRSYYRKSLNKALQRTSR